MDLRQNNFFVLIPFDEYNEDHGHDHRKLRQQVPNDGAHINEECPPYTRNQLFKAIVSKSFINNNQTSCANAVGASSYAREIKALAFCSNNRKHCSYSKTEQITKCMIINSMQQDITYSMVLKTSWSNK